MRMDLTPGSAVLNQALVSVASAVLIWFSQIPSLSVHAWLSATCTVTRLGSTRRSSGPDKMRGRATTGLHAVGRRPGANGVRRHASISGCWQRRHCASELDAGVGCDVRSRQVQRCGDFRSSPEERESYPTENTTGELPR